MRKAVFLLWIVVSSAAVFGQNSTQGSLYAFGKTGSELGACPLKHTAVKAEISGFIARVTVRQEFENSYAETIEAVYAFPLSQNGAVDEMTMTVGERVIKGAVMRRDEARKIYESAKSAGKTAALLDQERPNIFTQSVANILPGEKVVIEISYVETLKYEEGEYEFVFPMTVGPRYNPGSVADKSKISPPVIPTRSGSDISIEINLNAGVPVEALRSTTHSVTEVKETPAIARIKLRDEKTIANKDFVIRYDVTGKRIEDAVISHNGRRGGFFTLILQPPDNFAIEDRTPKEIVFVLDTSGSMYGFPLEKAKEAMKLSLDGLYPDDTFNLITFAGDTAILFDRPVPATQANLEAAHAFLELRQGGGGTEMMKAIRAALAPTDSQEHLRIVCFMTDGYVGNENEIIAEVQKHPKARIFAFGIGNSVNRFLLDKLASEGRGEVDYVTLTDDGSRAAKRFYERVRTPLLTDLSIDWNGLPVTDLYPSQPGDLFSAKPVIVHGRFSNAASGTIKLRGTVAGQPYEREIVVNLPGSENRNDALASLWARSKIDDLSSARTKAADEVSGSEIDTQITDLALKFGLMSRFTSFVAVEERIVNHNGTPERVLVPAALPDGVNNSIMSRNINELPMLNRSMTSLMSMNASVSQSVEVSVSGDAAAIDMLSSSVTSTFKRDSAGSLKPERSINAGTGSGLGSGRGSGSGSGSGIGDGMGSPPPPPTSVGDKQLAKPVAPKADTVKTKLHAWIYAIVERLAEGSQTATLNERHFVRGNSAKVSVKLTRLDDPVRRKLAEIGFVLEAEGSKNTVTGSITIDKLASLARIAEVQLVLPAI
jgi:Ca-activated chloride channel homolog